jgi:predicted acetyltransferase
MDIDKYDIFKVFEDYMIGKNLPYNYVATTYLWLVGRDEFIGEISIRHKLTNSLIRFGGNIGYGIRYSKWNNGFGTIMLAMALGYAKDVLRLKKVLITCYDGNIGSARVIEKNSGLLQDKIVNVISGVGEQEDI